MTHTYLQAKHLPATDLLPARLKLHAPLLGLRLTLPWDPELPGCLFTQVAVWAASTGTPIVATAPAPYGLAVIVDQLPSQNP
jgi:hypothetical protein